VKAREHRREREQVRLLNKYLRHEVLNSVQVIGANAELVAEHLDDRSDPHSRVSAIRDRSNDVATFVQSIRRILDARDFTLDLEAVDVLEIVESELERVAVAHEGVTVSPPTTDESVLVSADTLLGTVFTNLYENAAEHNDPPVTIDVSIDREDDDVVVRVADDGDGIPPDERAALFEPTTGSDHGHGLYLTRTLVGLYGGSIAVVESDQRGTTIEVRLNPASEGVEDRRPIPVE